MTDPVMADHIYLLPLNTKSIRKIVQKHKIDAVLPTMGGQTALNLCIEAGEKGDGIVKALKYEKVKSFVISAVTNRGSMDLKPSAISNVQDKCQWCGGQGCQGCQGSWLSQAQVDAIKGKGGGKGGGKAQEGCWICGSMNHIKRDCPQAMKGSFKGGGKGGQDQGPGGKGPPVGPGKGQAPLGSGQAGGGYGFQFQKGVSMKGGQPWNFNTQGWGYMGVCRRCGKSGHKAHEGQANLGGGKGGVKGGMAKGKGNGDGGPAGGKGWTLL